MKTFAYLFIFTGLLSACSKNEKADKIQTTVVQSASDIITNLVVASGRVEPDKEIVALSASEGGIVKSVLKKEGDIVTAGEVLIQLENDIEQSRIHEIQTAIETQLNQVEIEKNQLAEVQTNLTYKSLLLEKAKKLVARGAETQQVVDELINESELLKVKSSEVRIKIQLAQNKVKELKAQLNTSLLELSKKQFKVPVSGQLLNITAKKGGALSKYETYADFAPAGDYIVKAEVDELFAGKIKPGQQVDLVNTGSTKVIATGEIYYVAPYLKKKSLFSEKTDEQEDRRVREIKIRLQNKENLLINAKVECKIKL